MKNATGQILVGLVVSLLAIPAIVENKPIGRGEKQHAEHWQGAAISKREASAENVCPNSNYLFTKCAIRAVANPTRLVQMELANGSIVQLYPNRNGGADYPAIILTTGVVAVQDPGLWGRTTIFSCEFGPPIPGGYAGKTEFVVVKDVSISTTNTVVCQIVYITREELVPLPIVTERVRLEPTSISTQPPVSEIPPHSATSIGDKATTSPTQTQKITLEIVLGLTLSLVSLAVGIVTVCVAKYCWNRGICPCLARGRGRECTELSHVERAYATSVRLNSTAASLVDNADAAQPPIQDSTV